ncbi:MAG: class II aldolase/adducin family protein [Clostridia bacterium]|nr:class II aldolase/adducin family protein [Clostridia bacterium]
MNIKKLLEMSHRYGEDPAYVLAGGGNTSYKQDGVMWVKGSGAPLATMGEAQFVRMDVAKLTGMLAKGYPTEDAAREREALADMLAARLPGEEKKRPSVEAILHALFPYRYVLHTHPALVNGLTCGRDGECACKRLFDDRVVWIQLTKPGYILAKVCIEAFDAAHRATGVFPKVALMQNHGLIVAADSVEEIHDRMAEIMDALQAHVTREPDFSPIQWDKDKASALASEFGVSVFCTNAQVRAFVKDADAMAPLMAPFTPDHIVYCKHVPLFVKPGDDLPAAFDAYRKKHGFAPKIVAFEGLGFFALGKSEQEAETARLLFLDAMKVAVYAQAFGGYLPLPDDFTQFILNWEAESYRQKVAAP